jgi:hypothetical protein
MDIDSPTEAGGYAYRVLKTPGFAGVQGDGRIHVVGITGTTPADGVKAQLWLVNAKPSVNGQTVELLDSAVVGANSTIEVFEVQQGSDNMVHLKTYADPQIATPNNVAVVQDGGFFFTNDHGPHKVGWVSESPKNPGLLVNLAIATPRVHDHWDGRRLVLLVSRRVQESCSWLQIP